MIIHVKKSARKTENKEGNADFSSVKKRKRIKSTVETHGVSSELLTMVKSGMLTLVQARKIFKEGTNRETPSAVRKDLELILTLSIQLRK